MHRPRISIFCHFYYSDVYPKVLEMIRGFQDPMLGIQYFSICRDNPEWPLMADHILNTFPDAKCLIIPNRGKDIGGKLLMLANYLKQVHSSDSRRADYLVFLHDKKSPQSIDGSGWSAKLFRIIDPSYTPVILECFHRQKTGMVGCQEHVVKPGTNSDETVYATNKEHLKSLVQQYGIKTNDHSFIGGSMFWVREPLFNNFFTRHDPLKVFSSLESGNVMDNQMGTVTHSWERLLGWIVTSTGHNIVGVT